MQGLLATLVCVVNLFCSPVINYIGNEAGPVTNVYFGFTQQVVAGYGTVLVAHEGMAGSYLYYVEPGDIIEVRYQDGTKKVYEVIRLVWYQMMDNDTMMMNLDTGEVFTVAEVFDRDAKYLSLQTCLESADRTDPMWGRLFVVARPVDRVGHPGR